MTDYFLLEDVERVSYRVHESKTLCKKIILSYIKYVHYMSDTTPMVNFLGLCSLVNSKACAESSKVRSHTYAYQSRVVADELGISPVIVKAVLDEFKELLLYDVLTLHYSCNVYTLFNINWTSDGVRMSGSATLAKGVRVKQLSSFRYRTKQLAASTAAERAVSSGSLSGGFSGLETADQRPAVEGVAGEVVSPVAASSGSSTDDFDLVFASSAGVDE